MTEKIKLKIYQLDQAYKNLIDKIKELKLETESYVNNELKKINQD